MLDVAIRRPDGSSTVDPALLGRRATPPLPVAEAFAGLLPQGLRRGSTVTVAGSVSLALALVGAASADGAWCALAGFGPISAEAACEFGVELSRLAIVPPVEQDGWTTAVGALLDALDIVVARPVRAPLPADARRLSARARSRDAVLIPYVPSGVSADFWPGADVRLTAGDRHWTGIGDGTGRLVARQVDVTAVGRGVGGRSHSATLWLPAAAGGSAVVPVVAPVVELVS
jgi:hypothetical protein